jgi:dTDP-4-dehydrorhamnose 3,5-epimerase
MSFRTRAIPGLLLFEPPVFRDDRGSFREVWRAEAWSRAGLPPLLQDNVSCSARGVLRGLHYQHPDGQGKLVTVLRGAIWDVALDIRTGSPTFGQWVGMELDSGGRQFYIPPGFAHGFQALEEDTVVAYKCSAYYRPDAEGTVLWNDPDLAIHWPIPQPRLSPKDAGAPPLSTLTPDRLPAYPSPPLL